MNEWYCFEESFVWDESQSSDDENASWLDISPDLNGFTVNHIIDLYNIKLVTDIETVSCTNTRYCSTVCHESFGMGQKQAEELCSFANYDYDGGRLPYELNEANELIFNPNYYKNEIITQADYNLCINDVDSQDENIFEIRDLSFVGGKKPSCDLEKRFSDLIYDMYYSYDIIFTGDETCSLGYNSDSDDVVSCLTTNECISYLEDVVGMSNIPVGYSVGTLAFPVETSGDINFAYSTDVENFIPFVNGLDTAFNICDKMDVNDDGMINLLDVKSILLNENLDEKIYTCSSGTSFGQFCEDIPFQLNGVCSNTLGGSETSCNYYLDDCPEGAGDCILTDELINKYGARENNLCERYPIPNFLNFSNYNEIYDNFLRDTGYQDFDNYIHIEPAYNDTGKKVYRVGLRDTGLNENNSQTHIKTGYSKINMFINEGSGDGPTGSISSEELASFGFIPDTYRYIIGGTDERQQIPTKLTKDFDIEVFNYHPEATIMDYCDGDRTIVEKEECKFAGFTWIVGTKTNEDCGIWPGENPGFVNNDGECCSSIPVDSTLITNYYNYEKEHYYREEYQDEIELYISHYSGKNSKYCSATYTTEWEYSEYFDNNNIGGFEPPNADINPLDFTVSYRFTILDVVEDYDNIGLQNSRDWWGVLGVNYNNDEEWAESWNRLRREGWLDLFSRRVEGHPLGQVINQADADGYCVDDVADENSSCGFIVLDGDKLQQSIPNVTQGGLDDSVLEDAIYAQYFTTYAGSTTIAETAVEDFIDPNGLDFIGINYAPTDGSNAPTVHKIRYYFNSGNYVGSEEQQVGYCDNSNLCSDVNFYYINDYDTTNSVEYSMFRSVTQNYCQTGGLGTVDYDENIINNCRWYGSGITDSTEKNCNCYNSITLEFANVEECGYVDGSLQPELGNFVYEAPYPYGLYEVTGADLNICSGTNPDIYNCFKVYPDSIINIDESKYYNQCAGCATVSYRQECSVDEDCVNADGIHDGSVCVGGSAGSQGEYTPYDTESFEFFTQTNMLHDFVNYSLLNPHIEGASVGVLLKIGQDPNHEWIRITQHDVYNLADNLDYAEFTVERAQLGTQQRVDFEAGELVEIYVADDNLMTEDYTDLSFSKALSEGYEYQFEWPSIYAVVVEAMDTYGNISETIEYVDARNILLMEQTVRFQYDPWQGINVVLPEENDGFVKNQSWMVNIYDKDKRPALGCWFYDDLIGNKTDDWNIRHGDSYKDVEGGDFTKSYTGTATGDVKSWTPDAYVFTPTSLGSSNAVLTKYYDLELQPLAYQETSAPVEAQVYFYTRYNYTPTPILPIDASDDIFNEREMIKTGAASLDSNDFYIGFVDWGDGSDMEFDKEPLHLAGGSKLLTHLYTKSGIYDVTGDMFIVKRNTQQEVLGITYFKEFKLTINISRNVETEGEFAILGGDGYDFLPYNKTSPIIGGVSKYSLYYKILLNINGILNPDSLEKLLQLLDPDAEVPSDIGSVDIPYKYYGDKINSELAIVNMNKDTLKDLKLVPHFTGSLASDSLNIDEEEEVIIDIQDDACTYGNDYVDDNDGGSGLEGVGFKCELNLSPANGLYFMTGSYGIDSEDDNPFRDAFLDCEDECNIFEKAKNVKGFFDGVVDDSGELLGDDDNGNVVTPRLINRGIDLFPEELGDYLGNTDIGQVRYFNKPFQMWEMLGFEEPSDEDYTFRIDGTDILENLNGDFNTDGDVDDLCPDSDCWYPNDNWQIFSGLAMTDGTSSENINHSTGENLIQPGTTYEVKLHVGDIFTNNGGFRVRVGGTDGDNITEVGVTTQIITAETDERLKIYPINATVGSVEKIELRVVLDEGAEFNTFEEAMIAKSLVHPNSPSSPRYWKNIAPEDNLFYRGGIGTLPALPNAPFVDENGDYVGRPFEAIFGWGDLVKEQIDINGEIYEEYIEIIYSLSPGDDMYGIEFRFDGIEFPNITNSSDANFGGVVLSTLEGGFNFEVTITDGNVVRLSPNLDAATSTISAVGIDEDTFNIVDCEFGNCTGTISEIEFNDAQSEGYLPNQDFSDYDLNNDGFIDRVEAKSNIQSDVLIKLPIINRSNDIYLTEIFVFREQTTPRFIINNELTVGGHTTLLGEPFTDDFGDDGANLQSTSEILYSIFYDNNWTNPENIYAQEPYDNFLPGPFVTNQINTTEVIQSLEEGETNHQYVFNVGDQNYVYLPGIQWSDWPSVSPLTTPKDNLIYWDRDDDVNDSGISGTYIDTLNQIFFEQTDRIENILGQNTAAFNVGGNFVGALDFLEKGRFYYFNVTDTINLEGILNPIEFFYQSTIESQTIQLGQTTGIPVEDFWWDVNPYPYTTSRYSGYTGVIIDTTAGQKYLDINEYGINYYYPVLPKFKVNGYFDVQEEEMWENNLGLLGNQIPYGSSGRKWNQDDLNAPITSKLTEGKFLNHNVIDLDFSAIEEGVLNDIGANTNLGILIDDYDINFTENPIELFPDKPTIRTKIGKKENRKPY